MRAPVMTSSAVVGSSKMMQFGPAGEGGGDHDALLLAARGLVRIAAHHRGGIAQLDMARAASSPSCHAASRRQAAMAAQHLGELPAERQRRVERGRRVLEHHADARAADRRRSRAAAGAQILRRRARWRRDLARIAPAGGA